MEASSLLKRVRDSYCTGDYIIALEMIEEMSFMQGVDVMEANLFQGWILTALAEATENLNVRFYYWLGSIDCFSRVDMGSVYSAMPLFNMAEVLGSHLYYKKSLREAKDGLLQIRKPKLEHVASEFNSNIQELEYIIETAEAKIAVSETGVGEQTGDFADEDEDEEASWSDLVSRVNPLRSYWTGLNVETKRNFMKVRTADLKTHVKSTDGDGDGDGDDDDDKKQGQHALEQILTYARKHRKWKLWICRTCLKRFFTPEECTNHLEQKHAAKFKPSATKDIPQRISDVWSSKISVGGWEPVDAAAAVEKIKSHLADGKAFAYENGWSKDWPLAAVDKERRKLLKDIKLLLLSLCGRKILSYSIRDRMMHFVIKKLEISQDTLTRCGLVETPQFICFLECHELNQMLAFLNNIKRERDDGRELVCRAVDSFCGGTRFKEKIDFDSTFSTLLLDKRLLQCKVARYDDEGKINVFDPNVHYAKARASGDDFMSWLTDYSSRHTSFHFPRPIRAHNLGLWVAVLRAFQFTCRTLGTKYAKKSQLLEYDTALTDVRLFCISKDDRRRNLEKDVNKGTTYKSLLCDRCEQGDAAKTFLCAAQDALKESSHPRFESKKLSDDDLVLESLEFLKSEIKDKVALLDSKILLIENSRISLLNSLSKLAVFDYRFYIHHPLREYLVKLFQDLV